MIFVPATGGTLIKNPCDKAEDARDAGSIRWSGRSRGVGNGNPVQYSCLKIFKEIGAWQAPVHGVTKSWT